MSDTATRWVAPYWRNGDPPNFARVYVVNPGSEPTEVTARWFDMFGNQVQDGETIDARNLKIFVPPDGAAEHGWLRIIGTRPIIPWGETPVGYLETVATTSMTFYREEELQIKIPLHPLP